MGMEPGVYWLVLIAGHHAARILDCRADALVHALRIVGLGFADIGRDIRALVHAFLFHQKFQHKRSSQDSLSLERLLGPVVFHLTRQHAAKVFLQTHFVDLIL